MSQHYGLSPQAYTANPRDRQGQSRIKVDVANTGFWEGRTFHINYEFNLVTDATAVLKFTSPIGFVIFRQSMTITDGAVNMRAYNAGTDGGGWTAINVLSDNGLPGTPDYTSQMTVEDGGTFTPSGDPLDVVLLKTSGATAQRTSVSGSAGDERGYPSGSYYIVIESTGTSNGTGMFNVSWEERPDDLEDWKTEL